ncbi:MAG TPA: thiamine phosphate synthase [Terriglobia bacterium]|nr:thiamine phosphate synthase [Terriglobia bacterium]
MPSRISLYYITDRHGLGPTPLVSHLQAAVAAGVDLIQLREKDLDTYRMILLSRATVELAQESNTKILVNDRLDIAIATHAHGVHLGGRSMPSESVRRHVDRGFLVGVSCHSLEEALRAEAGEADYILLGPIFETPSKRPYGPPLGLNKLLEVAGRVSIPVLALGGITVERVRACLEAGATGIAGIRLFQEGPPIADRVRELRQQFH